MKAFYRILLPLIVITPITSTAVSDESISNKTNSKEVYNFTAENGTPVFTDMRPKNLTYKTQQIKTTDTPLSPPQNISNQQPSITHNTQINNNRTVIINQYNSKKTKQGKTRNKCKTYQKRLDDVLDKMRSGYTTSEYKRLEKERVKYRKLIFNRCESRLH